MEGWGDGTVSLAHRFTLGPIVCMKLKIRKTTEIMARACACVFGCVLPIPVDAPRRNGGAVD